MCLGDIHGGWLRSVTRGLLIVGGGYVRSPAFCTPLDVDTHGLCRNRADHIQSSLPEATLGSHQQAIVGFMLQPQALRLATLRVGRLYSIDRCPIGGVDWPAQEKSQGQRYTPSCESHNKIMHRMLESLCLCYMGLKKQHEASMYHG